jgi:hypothetical protein
MSLRKPDFTLSESDGENFKKWARNLTKDLIVPTVLVFAQSM